MRINQRERLARNEIRKMLPLNKDDVAAIEAIAARAYPAVQPILPDLLKWIRQDSWPVAKPIREFLFTIGPRLAPQVREALGSQDDSLKAVVLRRIVGEWPGDDVRGLSDQLFLIATDGQFWGADLLALRLLARHRIGDPAWIAGWLEFKRRHHEARLSRSRRFCRYSLIVELTDLRSTWRPRASLTRRSSRATTSLWRAVYLVARRTSRTGGTCDRGGWRDAGQTADTDPERLEH